MKALSLLIAIVAITGGMACGLDVDLRTYAPAADGTADDQPVLRRCFAAVVAAGGGTVVIPPGDYALAGGEPVPLCSHMRVLAHGARFHLPQKLGDRARLVLFSGTDIQDVQWSGGHFAGHCFDWRRAENPWEPNVSTRAILITTSADGATGNLSFRDVSSYGVAGAVITVLGALSTADERAVATYANNITVADCTFELSGKFMWDYGLLWQITVWPHEYDERERAIAARYFRTDLVSEVEVPVDGDRLELPTAVAPPSISRDGSAAHMVCFFGDRLPTNVMRGRQYAVVDSGAGFLRIADVPGGPPIHFTATPGTAMSMIRDFQSAYWALYAPTGSGPGKGAIDLVGCRNIQVHDCRISALGDAMHIQRSDGIIFTGNHITGSRMGAFFLAEYSRHAVISGNLVEGTNGSRVMSVERSCADVTIVGNSFMGGGRGSWINQPRNLVMQGNMFIDNTTKGEPDPHRGRRSFATGDYEHWPELYFTTYEAGATYGPVVLSGNSFTTGAQAKAAIRFESGGRDIVMEGNNVTGSTGALLIEGDAQVQVGSGNRGFDPILPHK